MRAIKVSLGSGNSDLFSIKEARLTNADNIGEDWKSATPRDGTQVGPLVVHSTGSSGQVLVQNVEDDESDNLRENTSSDGQTLNNKVGRIDVGRFRD